MDTEQLRLSGFTEAQIQEAAVMVSEEAHFSALLHAIDYSPEQFMSEMKSAMDRMKEQSRK